MEIGTVLTPVDDNEQPDKRRRKRSTVWEHFTVETVGAGCARAYCKQCKKSFVYINGYKNVGTSDLKRHISLGKCPVIHQNNQQILYPKTSGSGDNVDPPRKRARKAPGFAGMSLDHERSNRDITKMIIFHDYPLQIVEHRGFIDFVHSLQPQFNVPCINSVHEDCVGIYLRGKKKLFNLIDGISGRVNLTADLWTSNQTAGYILLRGHFIDNDWNLHRPILSVNMVPFPDSDDSVGQSVLNCLNDWDLKGQLFTLALDRSFFNETSIRRLRDLLSMNNPVILNGQLLSCNCYARVLSRLALHALWTMRETISKVRECVKCVKTSESNEVKFLEIKHNLQVPSMKDLIIDNKTKWDTTYHMLVAACELKEVFACFDTSEPDIRMILSMGEWKKIETLCTYLKYLFDATNILTALHFPTANLFFHEVSKLQLELTHAATSQDPFLNNLIKPLQEKFDQYWRESCLIMAVAVTMDPRYKLKLVELTFNNIFGANSEPWIRIVEDGLRDLFLKYIEQVLPFTASNGDEENEVMIRTDSCQNQSFDESLLDAKDGQYFDIYYSDFTCDQMKSELEQYLEDPPLSSAEKFDIMRWWKLSRLKYPTLSRMASDILSIPFSTLSADSVFDTKPRNMNCYRSSLDSMTLEALVCAKDWLHYESLPIDASNAPVKMEF